MGKKLIDAITSLKLTVICLVIAMILVFVGTLAQVELGLYETQKVYFLCIHHISIVTIALFLEEILDILFHHKSIDWDNF